jgi:charged multivesicular body protein 5
MRRLFGQKKEEAPKPTLDDASQRLGSRGEAMDMKCKKLDEELLKLKQQIQNSRGPTQARLKQRAMQILQQKRMYEKQKDQVYQQQFNIDQLQFTQEMMKDTHLQVSAMKDASKQLKKDFKNFKIEDVEKMQDELRDLYEDTQEIQEMMGRMYDVPEDVDEDELAMELDALAFDMEKEKDASYLDDALTTPAARLPELSRPANSTGVAEQPQHDPQSLEAQLGL